MLQQIHTPHSKWTTQAQNRASELSRNTTRHTAEYRKTWVFLINILTS